MTQPRKAAKSGATVRNRERRKPVLIVQHAPHEHPAALRRAVETQGILSLWIHPYKGDVFPAIDTISGLISMGGPMGANDEAEHAWISPECALMRLAIERRLPVVGICLGGQLLARALGGRVERHRTSEVGWFPLELNPTGERDPVMGAAGRTPKVYHWHGDTFFPPAGAELLASSTGCERQAYRIGENAYGFQFHPEADHQLVHEWLALEGVDEEIDAVRRRHGRETIQDSKTQRSEASSGERSSLKITAAIGALFRGWDRDEAKPELKQRLHLLADTKREFLLEFEGSDRKTLRLRGHVSAILAVPAGEFVIFREHTSLLWPIRMEDVKAIADLS